MDHYILEIFQLVFLAKIPFVMGSEFGIFVEPYRILFWLQIHLIGRILMVYGRNGIIIYLTLWLFVYLLMFPFTNCFSKQDSCKSAICCSFKREESPLYIWTWEEGPDTSNRSNYSICTTHAIPGPYFNLYSTCIFLVIGYMCLASIP